MKEHILETLLDNEYTYDEFISEISLYNRDNAIPLPLLPKLIELLFQDKLGTDSVCYLIDDQYERFMKMAFGHLSSAQQAELYMDIYKENKHIFDGDITDAMVNHDLDTCQYWKDFLKPSYKEMKEMSLGATL